MGQYWIRNRGRIQGPFTIDRLQGLMRRGRFNRHFHVSMDRKEWYPAGDVPELFDGVSSTRGSNSPDEEDGVFQGGGSPFDEDFTPAPISGSTGRRSSPFATHDEHDSEYEDEEWEDDDSRGALSGVVDWIEANNKGLVVLLLLVLGGLGWFVFGRESFSRDQADLEQLIEIQTKISAAHLAGSNSAAWVSLSEDTKKQLAPMIERLEETASQRDHVKQELLFAARDDIPLIFDELPVAKGDAEERIQRRFSQVKQMIRDRIRISTSRNTIRHPPVVVPEESQIPAKESERTVPESTPSTEASTNTPDGETFPFGEAAPDEK